MLAGSVTNHKIVLRERPQRGPITDRTFERVSEELGELKDGEVRVRVDYVSIVSTSHTLPNSRARSLHQSDTLVPPPLTYRTPLNATGSTTPAPTSPPSRSAPSCAPAASGAS